MTTEEEVKQAEKDYRLCQNGFEKAQGWNSFVVYEDDDPSTLLPWKKKCQSMTVFMLNSVFACCNVSVWKRTENKKKNVSPWQCFCWILSLFACCNWSVWKKTGTRKNIDPWQSVHVEFCLCCNASVWKKTGTRKNIDPWQSVHVEFCLCLLVATCLCERRQEQEKI